MFNYNWLQHALRAGQILQKFSGRTTSTTPKTPTGQNLEHLLDFFPEYFLTRIKWQPTSVKKQDGCGLCSMGP